VISGWEYPSVAVSVVRMSRAHTSYDEIDSPATMRVDAAAAGRALRLGRLAEAAVAGAPSLEYDDFAREVPKREIAIDEAAARIANALHLHLD
jgi:hypothetical protein